MNISAIMRIPDQATRNFAYAQALEIDALKAEIEALKKKPPNHSKGGEMLRELGYKSKRQYPVNYFDYKAIND